jgi:hypothetical protein
VNGDVIRFVFNVKCVIFNLLARRSPRSGHSSLLCEGTVKQIVQEICAGEDVAIRDAGSGPDRIIPPVSAIGKPTDIGT